MNPGYSLTLVLGLIAVCWAYAWLGLRWGVPDAAVQIHRRYAALDGLRGMLALSVFAHHAYCTRVWYATGEWGAAGNRVILQAGWEAVTLFFFITGFLFWTKLQREPRLSFLGHLRSRILRLGPAYWAAIAVVLLVVAIRTGGQLRVPAEELARSAGSWLLFAIPGRPDVNGLENTRNIIANVPWTLALEWAFYLLVPFLGWFASNIFRTSLFLGLAYVALRFLMMGSLGPYVPEAARSFAIQTAYHLTRTFGAGIVVAALLPWLQAKFGNLDFKRPVFSAISLAGILVVMLFADPVYAFRESLPLLIPFAIVVLGNDWFGILTSRPSQFLGQISYSIYLLHGIVLHVVFLVVNRFFPVAAIPAAWYWLIIVSLGAVVVAVAARWYRRFEAPFISRKT